MRRERTRTSRQVAKKVWQCEQWFSPRSTGHLVTPGVCAHCATTKIHY